MIGFISWDSRIKSQLKRVVVLKVSLSLLVFKKFKIWAFIQRVMVNFVVTGKNNVIFAITIN